LRRLTPALAVLALAVSACSSSSSTTTGTAGQPASGAGVKLTVPDGWTSRTVSGRGLVVASKQLDLDADVPTGPRLVANLASGEIPDPVALLESAKGEQPSVQATPEPVTVDGKSGIAVESSLTRGSVALVSRLIVVQLAQGSAYTLTLEAPEDQWDSNKGTLQDILDSIRFTSTPP
jgi:hypothetical protein